jgi:DNA-directed RNA polymerase specialized sigma subunit
VSERADKDLLAWTTWKADPSDENLEVLLDRVDKLIQHHVNRYRNHPVPPVAIKTQARIGAINAFKSYNPNANTNLATWVTWNLGGTKAFVSKYQNLGKIPTDRTGKARGDFQNARARLREELGREPYAAEIAQVMDISPSRVDMFIAEERKDLIASMTPGSDTRPDADRGFEDMAIRNTYATLRGRDKEIIAYVMGLDGKPQLPNKDIIQRLGLTSPSTVSKAKKKFDRRLRKDWGV